MPGRPCPVTLLLSGRGEPGSTDVNNYYINQGRMGYKVLDGCLPRCRDVREIVEGFGDGAEIQGEYSSISFSDTELHGLLKNRI